MNVSLQHQDGIAIITIDNPPVNAMGRAVREWLLDLAHQTEADSTIHAVILMGAGQLFVGGADITEFDRPPEPPQLPELLTAIENSKKPWIAAVHGVALGGGFELALACRYRVASPGSRFGLPEVNLGIIPGAGGTQRLPRIIGVDAALPVIAERKMIDHGQALASGLVKRVIEGSLLDGAVQFAIEVAQVPLPPAASDMPARDPGVEFWRAAEARISKASKGQSAPLLALAALHFGITHGFAKGLSNERETFLKLRAGSESAALRYLFFAERAAQRPTALRGIVPPLLQVTGVIGGGTMGVGIAAALRNAGLPVILSERDESTLARALSALKSIFESAAKRGAISPEEASTRMAGVTGITGLDGMADCDLVIEAVYEDLTVKREVFAGLARICRANAILATNTSYIDPRLIAEGLAGQDRFIGLHFFSPAQIMKLLEVIPLPETSPLVLAAAYALAAKMGKVAVQSGICDGFIGNRILRRYRAEAEALVRDGVAHAEIDAVMRNFGYQMGPFEMQDLAGLDISFMYREAARTRGARVPETLGDVLVRAGRKGQKTGGGWYDYRTGDRTPHLSGDVDNLIRPMCAARRQPAPDEIVSRLINSMAAEGQSIIDEGIVTRAEDVDLVEVHGYGFPRSKGGPMFMSRLRSAS